MSLTDRPLVDEIVLISSDRLAIVTTRINLLGTALLPTNGDNFRGRRYVRDKDTVLRI